MKFFKGVMGVVLAFLVLFTVTGCGNKTAISAEDFKTKLEDKGYVVQDATDQMNGAKEVKKVYIAIDSSSSYQIEFYELASEDNAVSFFNENKKTFENSKSSTNAESSVEMGNHAKYTLSGNDTYKVISRIDNTAIYVDVNDKYKSDVESLLKDLDY